MFECISAVLRHRISIFVHFFLQCFPVCPFNYSLCWNMLFLILIGFIWLLLPHVDSLPLPAIQPVICCLPTACNMSIYLLVNTTISTQKSLHRKFRNSVYCSLWLRTFKVSGSLDSNTIIFMTLDTVFMPYSSVNVIFLHHILHSSVFQELHICPVFHVDWNLPNNTDIKLCFKLSWNMVWIFVSQCTTRNQ